MLRRMIKQDIPEINHFFECPLELRDLYRNKAIDAAVVDVHGGYIGGYIVALKDQWATEVLWVEVCHDLLRKGYGSSLITYLSSLAGDDLSVETRVRNDDIIMQKFLKKNHFECVGDTIPVDGVAGLLFRRGWRFRKPPLLKFRGVKP